MSGCVRCGRWQAAPSEALLQGIAARTEGFAGADLQALCTAAVMAAVSRAAPTLVDQLLLEEDQGGPCHDQEQLHPNQQQPLHKRQAQQQGPILSNTYSAQDLAADPAPQAALAGEAWQQKAGQKLREGSKDRQQPQQQHEDEQQELQEEVERGAQLGLQRWPQLDYQQPHQPQPLAGSASNSEMGQQDWPQHQLRREDLLQQQQQGGSQEPPRQLPQKLPRGLLEKLRVKAVDWRTALAGAPLPCSARANLSALSSGHARALPHHLVPLVLPALVTVLRCIAAAQLPWQGSFKTALEAVGAADRAGSREMQGDETKAVVSNVGRLESVLIDLGAVESPYLYKPGLWQPKILSFSAFAAYDLSAGC